MERLAQPAAPPGAMGSGSPWHDHTSESDTRIRHVRQHNLPPTKPNDGDANNRSYNAGQAQAFPGRGENFGSHAAGEFRNAGQQQTFDGQQQAKGDNKISHGAASEAHLQRGGGSAQGDTLPLCFLVQATPDGGAQGRAGAPACGCAGAAAAGLLKYRKNSESGDSTMRVSPPFSAPSYACMERKKAKNDGSLP